MPQRWHELRLCASSFIFFGFLVVNFTTVEIYSSMNGEEVREGWDQWLQHIEWVTLVEYRADSSSLMDNWPFGS